MSEHQKMLKEDKYIKQFLPTFPSKKQKVNTYSIRFFQESPKDKSLKNNGHFKKISNVSHYGKNFVPESQIP
jgi:hypothetical protein